MNKSVISILLTVATSCAGLVANPAVSSAQEGALCPCNFAGAARTRALTGNEMSCSSQDVDVFNVPPEGITNKQNRFTVTERNRKGAISKVITYSLYEQGLLPAADFGGTVRYAPTCDVRQAGKNRIRVKEAAYILTGAEYADCARDLTALVESVIATASNAPVASCDDDDNSGVADVWEPMNPVVDPVCFDEFGNRISCPELP